MSRVLAAAAAADGISLALKRRGYSTKATWKFEEGILKQVEVKKMVVGNWNLKRDGGPDSSWVPDPVTGYYRPGNMVEDVDVAEQRQLRLSQTVLATTDL
ncbi:hypothetical protein ACLOJK_026249 [Asimina triloba]